MRPDCHASSYSKSEIAAMSVDHSFESPLDPSESMSEAIQLYSSLKVKAQTCFNLGCSNQILADQILASLKLASLRLASLRLAD